MIINDAQIRRLIIEEFYDPKTPRFELELFGESTYSMNYNIIQREVHDEPIKYELPSNRKLHKATNLAKKTTSTKEGFICNICGKTVTKQEMVSANKGTTLFCRGCFKKLF